MGKCSSRFGDPRRRSNVFRVYNVDECGNKQASGDMEVTSTDLVLYQRRRDAIVWPLKSLRRYGYDQDLFSFESGRRCATGAGIFAFKCMHAEELFTQVHDSILDHGRAEGLLPPQEPLPVRTGVNGSPMVSIRVTDGPRALRQQYSPASANSPPPSSPSYIDVPISGRSQDSTQRFIFPPLSRAPSDSVNYVNGPMSLPLTSYVNISPVTTPTNGPINYTQVTFPVTETNSRDSDGSLDDANLELRLPDPPSEPPTDDSPTRRTSVDLGLIHDNSDHSLGQRAGRRHSNVSSTIGNGFASNSPYACIDPARTAALARVMTSSRVGSAVCE